jgi:signal transduction histidine kinase
LASGGEAHPERVPLDDIVTEMTEELSEFAAECGVRVAANLPHALIVLADRDGVRTVVRNLLHNAIKASPREGVVQVHGEAETHDVLLEVTDDGVGFPPREAPRLFEQFYRVEGDGRGRMQGTGLGLYLVERLVAQAGGRVRAQSAGLGLGAVFSVRWPRPAVDRLENPS